MTLLRSIQTFCLLASAATAALAAAGCAGRARVSYVTYATVRPPAPLEEDTGPAPSDDAVWVNGYWYWNGADHVWVRGHWAPRPDEHYVWVRSGWVLEDREYRFVPGRWVARDRVPRIRYVYPAPRLRHGSRYRALPASRAAPRPRVRSR